MKKVFINAIVFVAIVACFGAATVAQRILGGYNKAETDNEHVVAAAEFAVNKKAEEQEGLTLVSIEKAETQSAAGTNFRLCLKVSLDEEEQEVKVVVRRDLKQQLSLTSWTVENCSDGGTKETALAAGATITNAAFQNSVEACRGEQLSLRETEPEADMGGKRFGNFVFKNISSTPCTLTGFPKFAPLNKAGRALRGVKVEYTNDFFGATETESENAPQTVTLAQGKTAWFQIYYNDGMALEHKKPFPVSAKVQITAPNTQRAFVLSSVIQACCGVQVSAVRAGLPQ